MKETERLATNVFWAITWFKLFVAAYIVSQVGKVHLN